MDFSGCRSQQQLGPLGQFHSLQRIMRPTLMAAIACGLFRGCLENMLLLCNRWECFQDCEETFGGTDHHLKLL